ncbi:MAG: MFS transporter [Actinomycetota bacterium]
MTSRGPDTPPAPGRRPAAGQSPGSDTSGFRHGLRAFQHRDFRLFFIGALASNTGNWIQNLAVPFVLFELTGQALWVGLASFAQFIPAFLLGPVGGWLADRMDRRRLLLISQFLMAVAASALWASWAVGWRNPALILALTALTGIFSGLMIPSWQAFVPSLVPRVDLPSAITLNSTQFNASRALGPALAGVLLGTAGAGLAFFLNVVSFLAVIGMLWIIRPEHGRRGSPGGATAGTAGPGGPGGAEDEGVLAAFRSALGYISKRTGIMVGIASAMLAAFFGNPVTQFTVVFGEDVYDAGPTVVGLLASAIGIGAVLIAPFLSTWDGRIPRSVIVRWGLPLYGLAVMAFGASPNWPTGLLALFAVGAGFLAVISTTNTSVQMIVADEMRGRVMSTRVMGFTLAFPVGSLIQGALADWIGPRTTVIGAGGCLVVAALVLATRPATLATLDHEDDTPDRSGLRSGLVDRGDDRP